MPRPTDLMCQRSKIQDESLCYESRKHDGSLQFVAGQHGNLFAAMMEAVKVASLGKVSGALCEVGGIYRRNM